MYLDNRVMKPASGKSQKARHTYMRPFRMLAVAATVLVASVLIAGCQKSAPKNTPPLHLNSSFQESKKWNFWINGMDENQLKDAMRQLGEEAIRHSEIEEGELRTAKSAERKAILSKAVGKLEAHRLVGDGLTQGSDSLDFEVRKEDSLFLVKAICDEDSERLVGDARWKVAYRQTHAGDSVLPARPAGGNMYPVNADRWRDSLIAEILNATQPMLPEAGQRRHDSLLLLRTMVVHVERLNQVLIEDIFHDSTYADEDIKDTRLRNRCMGIYERMKLPDGRTRKQDSLELIRRFASLQKQFEADQREEQWLEERRMERKKAKHHNVYVPGSSPPPSQPGWTPPMPHWAGRE
jgi:hypothetical protein